MICQDFDELLKQVAQSPSGRPPDIFYDLCLKLIDRVFGENATLCECQPGTDHSTITSKHVYVLRIVILWIVQYFWQLQFSTSNFWWYAWSSHSLSLSLTRDFINTLASQHQLFHQLSLSIFTDFPKYLSLLCRSIDCLSTYVLVLS